MTAAEVLTRKIEAIVARPDTKADRARALYALGCDIRDAVDLLDMAYSQAHSIWRQTNGTSSGNTGRNTSHRQRAATASAGQVSDDEGSGEGTGGNAHRSGRYSTHRALYLTPTQTRFITQDGHEIVRLDTHERGSICYTCEKEVQFSLRYLGFVHTYSTQTPTNIEDKYEQ